MASSLLLSREKFLELLKSLISQAALLQNAPPRHVPQENLACQIVLDRLAPYSTTNGGPLIVEHFSYVPGRGNIKITFPGKTKEKSLALIGSHLDVVPADPETWSRNPFELIVEDDNLYGRGTTDCLGHVALITELFIALAEKKIELSFTLYGVFIASEESTTKGVGVETLMEHGVLDELRNGGIIWVDCADTHPCIGTAGAMTWHLKTQGRLFHSGLPHKGINALELAMDALIEIQKRFYADFPQHEKEIEYNYATSSTLKPTQISVPPGGLNQLPPKCTISGDVRLTPFYQFSAVREKLNEYVQDLNNNLETLSTVRGPFSKYVLPDLEMRGKVEIEFDDPLVGIACKLDSPVYRAILSATKEVVGEANPYSICGSLPLVDQLQAAGFDVQLVGYGLSSAYHADNEYCKFSDMEKGFRVLCNVIHQLNEN